MINNPFRKIKPEPVFPIPLPDWLNALPELEPCGPNLEYDPEYVILTASFRPRGEVQYGEFIAGAEVPNWAEVERACRRLLLRSRDIGIAIMFLRCRTRLAQAEGLREGLTLLLALLEQFPDQLHPQLILDGEFDPAVRANALAALSDPQGLLGDIREIVIAGSSAQRLQVRDVERAYAVPRAVDAVALASVQRQLAELRQVQHGSLHALMQVQQLALRLVQLIGDDLGEAAPDLRPLLNVLVLFNGAPLPVMESPIMPPITPPMVSQEPVATANSASVPVATLTESGIPHSERLAALQLIAQARSWFELHEPSSPVAILLQQAEKMVGKRYSEVAHCIPQELLQSWEKQ